MLFAQDALFSQAALLAQDGGPAGGAFNIAIFFAAVIPIAVIFLLALFLFALLRHLRFNREKLHAERLKMIEMGLPLEEPAATKRQDKHMHNAFWIAFWMVVVVPSSAFSAATAATERGEHAGYLLAIWIGASVVSVAAVVCAAVLVILSRARRDDDDELSRPIKK